MGQEQANIIDIEPTQNAPLPSVFIRTIVLRYRRPKYGEPKEMFGAITSDIGGCVVVFPMHTNPTHSSKFLHEMLLFNNTKVNALIQHSYQMKTNIVIDDKPIYWEDYEHIFKQCSFYQEPTPVALQDFEPQPPENGEEK